MDFENLFGGPAVVAKQLERRWAECGTDTADNSNSDANADIASALESCRRRSVPYLRRNILYCRDPYDKPRFPRWRHEERSADVRHVLPKEDMLSKLFGHKAPLHHNEALQLVDQDGQSDQEDSSLVANTSTAPSTPSPTRKNKRLGTPGRSPVRSPISAGNRLSTPTTKTPLDGTTTTTNMAIPPSQQSRHTKVFYDVKMAHPQSPGVALSPTTVEMKYGKAFPPYEPRVMDGAAGNGRWVRPESPRTAYALFANLTRGQARRFLQRRERNDEKKVDEQLQKLWANGSTTTHLYWKQEEEWDKQRYMHETTVYARARQLTEGYAAPVMEEKKDDENTGKPAVAGASTGQDSISNDADRSTRRKRQSRDVYTQKNIVPRRATNVYYHYLHLKDGMSAAQVEQRRDCRCPLCYQNCVTDVGLLMHCQLVHGPTLSFEAAKDEDANLHIGVRSEKFNNHASPLWKDVAADKSCVRSCLSRPQQGWDPANAIHERPITNSRLTRFVYVRRHQLPNLAEIKFFKRPFTSAAYLDPSDRRKKSDTLREQGADEDVIQRLLPDDQVPIRQYYHSKTNLPMCEGEWYEDSDDDPDDGWREKMGEQLLDEFDDVSAQEKQLMKLWNRHMNGSDEVVADRSIPAKCMDFIKLRGDELAELGLRWTLFLHFCNLWDEEIISSKHVSTLMSYYDQRCKDSSNKAKKATSSPRTPRSPSTRRKTPLKHNRNSTASMSPSKKRAKKRSKEVCV